MKKVIISFSGVIVAIMFAYTQNKKVDNFTLYSSEGEKLTNRGIGLPDLIKGVDYECDEPMIPVCTYTIRDGNFEVFNYGQFVRIYYENDDN